MSKHDNFKKHWYDMGEPDLEFFFNNDCWVSVDEEIGVFYDDDAYRIKGDKHWMLRQKWIDSGFTLQIECKSTLSSWEYAPKPEWHYDVKYREAVMQKETSIKVHIDDLNVYSETKDQGKHYRFMYRGIKLDPFRLADIFKLNGQQLTILKKTIANGDRGHKDAIQDYEDIICAAKRAIEMIIEDREN